MISVIVPVYNVERYLDKCIQSIIDQEYSDLEILLIDDGSTDKSAEICDFYASKDDRIKCIHKKNGGVSSARNVGLDIAVGEYISFIDSDDYIDKNYFFELIKKGRSSTSGIVCCNLMWEQDEVVFKINTSSKNCPLLVEKVEEGFFHNGYIKDLMYGPYNKIISKNIIGDTRFDTNLRLGEDLLFVFSILLKTQKVDFIINTNYHYVMRAGSAVHTKSLDKQLEYVKAADKIMYLCRDNGLQCIEACRNWRYRNILNFLFEVTMSKTSFDKDLTSYFKEIKEINRTENLKQYIKRVLIILKFNKRIKKDVH